MNILTVLKLLESYAVKATYHLDLPSTISYIISKNLSYKEHLTLNVYIRILQETRNRVYSENKYLTVYKLVMIGKV